MSEKEIKNTEEVKKEVENISTAKEEKAIVKKSVSDKTVIFSIIGVVVAIALSIFAYYFYGAEKGSIATYDGGKVNSADYTVYYKTFYPMLSYYQYPENEIPVEIAKKAALDKIILKMAKEAGVKITDEDKAKVDEVFNDKEKVKQFQEQGIDIGKLKDLYCNDYIIISFTEKLAKEAKSEDVIAFIKSKSGENANLNEYNTRHILVKTSKGEDPQTGSTTPMSDAEKADAKVRAEAILARVNAGEDFETLAKELSEDTGTKSEGGKFTMYDDGKVMEAYDKAVKELKPGQVTATLVETEAGYHIIKLENVVENGRGNSESEKEAYVDNMISQLEKNKNVKIIYPELSKLVEGITGKKVELKEETATEENTNTQPEVQQETQPQQ